MVDVDVRLQGPWTVSRIILIVRLVAASWRCFGFSWSFLRAMVLVAAFCLGPLLNAVFLALDHIVFPRHRDTPLLRPVFIIGHPRSGTSFLHGLLAEVDEVAAYETWQVLFPALTSRTLVRPVVRYLSRKRQTEMLPAETGHAIALDKVEEEELLFLHNMDTQFVVITTPLGFEDDDFRELRFHDQQPRQRRMRSVAFLKSCFRRHLYDTGKSRICAQTHFSTHRVRTLLDTFPDAKFVYLDRTPAETLPSYFSLNHAVLDRVWGLQNFKPGKVEAYFQRRYRASVELYKYFKELQCDSEFKQESVLVVPYDDLRTDLPSVFDRVCKFADIHPSEVVRGRIREIAARQHSYKRKHVVKPLSEFGIHEDSVGRDFAFLWDGQCAAQQRAGADAHED